LPAAAQAAPRRVEEGKGRRDRGLRARALAEPPLPRPLSCAAEPVEAWTRRIIRHRRPVIAAWLVLLVLGGAAASGLGDLLSNRFSVPGSEAEQGRQVLSKRMGEKGDGDFTLVVQSTGGAAAARSPAFTARAEAAARRAATAVKGAKV